MSKSQTWREKRQFTGTTAERHSRTISSAQSVVRNLAIFSGSHRATLRIIEKFFNEIGRYIGDDGIVRAKDFIHKTLKSGLGAKFVTTDASLTANTIPKVNSLGDLEDSSIVDDGTSVSGTVNIHSDTISSGDIALPSHSVPGVWVVIADTESAAATDDLDHITGGVEGDILYVRQVNSARDVTIKHNFDANPGRFNNQASGSADIVFVDTTSVAHYINRAGTVWDEIASQV